MCSEASAWVHRFFTSYISVASAAARFCCVAAAFANLSALTASAKFRAEGACREPSSTLGTRWCGRASTSPPGSFTYLILSTAHRRAASYARLETLASSSSTHAQDDLSCFASTTSPTRNEVFSCAFSHATMRSTALAPFPTSFLSPLRLPRQTAALHVCSAL